MRSLTKLSIIDPLRYLNGDDVHRRLHNTIVRYQGQPVFCRQCEDSLYLDLRPLRKTSFSIKEIHSSDEELDVSSPPLGYMNTPTCSVYVQRVATRKQHQGFCTNVAQQYVEGELDDSLNSYFAGPHMADLIEDIYPKISACINKLKNHTVWSVAFHRKFSFNKIPYGPVNLNHMNRPIGWMHPDNLGTVLLQERYSNPIFQEQLQELGLETKIQNG